MAMLEDYLVSGPMPNGDWDARCPLHNDKKRSCRINFDTGQWICFAGCGKGRLPSLLKRMREGGGRTPPGEARDPSRPHRGGEDGSKLEKKADRWHSSLVSDDAIWKDGLWRIRGISLESIRRFRLGWDRARQAFTKEKQKKEEKKGGLTRRTGRKIQAKIEKKQE